VPREEPEEGKLKKTGVRFSLERKAEEKGMTSFSRDVKDE